MGNISAHRQCDEMRSGNFPALLRGKPPLFIPCEMFAINMGNFCHYCSLKKGNHLYTKYMHSGGISYRSSKPLTSSVSLSGHLISKLFSNFSNLKRVFVCDGPLSTTLKRNRNTLTCLKGPNCFYFVSISNIAMFCTDVQLANASKIPMLL